MNLSFLMAALLMSSPAPEPRGELPPKVIGFIGKHCAACHDADSVLDLRSPPAPHDTRAWTEVLQAVESGRMPPPPEEAAQEQPPSAPPPAPLTPALRQEFVRALTAMLHPLESPAPPRETVQLSPEEWLLIAREVALPFMTEEELGRLIAPRQGFAIEGRLSLIAADICTRLVGVDLGRPVAARRLLRRLSSKDNKAPPDAEVEDIVRQTFGLVYQQEPTHADVQEGRTRFRRFLKVAGSAQEATAALCTSYLAGPRVMLLRFTGNPPKR